MVSIFLSSTLRRRLLPLASALALAACGGSGAPAVTATGVPAAAASGTATGVATAATTPSVPSNTPVVPPAPTTVLLPVSAGSYTPGGIAVDRSGTIYLANNTTHGIVKVAPSGAVSEFVKRSSNVPADPGFLGSDINHLAFDERTQTLYAIDRSIDPVDGRTSASGTVRAVSPKGELSTLQLSTFATHVQYSQSPVNTGNLAAALAVGADGLLYATTMNFTASVSSYGPKDPYFYDRQLSWRTLNPDGSGQFLFSQEVVYSKGDPASPANPTYPADLSATGGLLGTALYGLAVDRAHNAYIADRERHVIIKVTPAGVASIFAGKVNTAGTADGAAADARLDRPGQIAIDKSGNLYVLTYNGVRKMTPDGVVSTVVQNVAAAGIAIDDNGRLYLSVDKGVLRVELP